MMSWHNFRLANIKYIFFLFLYFFIQYAFAWQADIEADNTNIFTSNSKDQNTNYNRFRIYLNLTNTEDTRHLLKIIHDNENFYNLKEHANRNINKIYRAYWQYTQNKSMLTIGRQRVSLGVGKIWNPIDVFNPINIEDIESNERKGDDIVKYQYDINEQLNLNVILAEKKKAIRLKRYFNFADMSLIALNDNIANEDMLGFDLQGELLETGVELRSEGGFFKPKQEGKNYQNWIIGAEYAFQNSLIALIEYKKNTKNNDNLATSFAYSLSFLSNINAIIIHNLDDNSNMQSISLDYSLSDDKTLDIGFYSYQGNDKTQYGDNPTSYYLKFFIHF